MKIVLFIDSLGSGGAQRQLCGLASMLKTHGYEVIVATYFCLDFFKQLLDDANIPNEIIPKGSDVKKRIGAVRSYFIAVKPDWVIAYLETPSLLACAAKLLGCKYKLIVSERNTTQHIGVNEFVRFFLYHWSDKIVPNSYSQASFLSSHYPWMKSKLKTITNFVDLERFSYVQRARHCIPEIVVVASIWESKNTLKFIDAVNELVKKGASFHVSWYGKSDENLSYYNQCQEKISGYRIQKIIEMKDKTKNIVEAYQKADFFCLPSSYEGTPNVICEAISTGLPVACSDVCDNSIYVLDNLNGYLFDPSSLDSIVCALEKLLSVNMQEYTRMSKNSRRIAEEKLSQSVFIKEYLEVIGQSC